MIRNSKFGGLIPRIHARILPNGSAEVSVDVNLEHGSIKPWPKPSLKCDVGQDIVTIHFDKNCACVTWPIPVDVVDYIAGGCEFKIWNERDRLRIESPPNFCNGLECFLGVPCPTEPLLIDDDGIYVYTWINKFGQESPPFMNPSGSQPPPAALSDCNEIWNVGVLIPDLHVGGVVSNVWNGDLIRGIGVLKDARVDTVYTTNDTDNYTRYPGFNPGVEDGVAEVFYPECQWYNYAGPLLDNQMAGTTFDLSDAEWTPFGTPTFAFADGLDGEPLWSVIMTDNNPAGVEGVFKGTALNSLPVDTEPFVTRFAIHKATGALDDSELKSNPEGGPGIEIFFNTFTGVATLGAGVGPNQAFEVRGNGNWWEVYLQTDADNSGTRVLVAIVTSTPSGAGDIRVADVAVFVHRTIGMVRGGAIEPKKNAASPSSVIDISRDFLDAANHDDTEGGDYIEFRPMYGHSEITRDVEVLSLNDAPGLLYIDRVNALLTATDGVNVATVPLTLVAETKYRCGVIWGDFLRVGVDSVWGTAVPYDGAFAGGSDLVVCRNEEAVNIWRELRGFHVSYTDAFNEISLLMEGIGIGTDWEYVSTNAAEASGDPWAEGDIITITGGPVFIYNTNLAAPDDISGLIHREPYGAGNGVFTGLTVHGSELADSDPDAWTSGWLDISTGVQGVDYELDTASNLSRFRDLTPAGMTKLITNKKIDSGDTESFRIIDDISGVTTASTAFTFLLALQLQVYKDGVNRNWITLEGSDDGTSINWRVNHTTFLTFADTLKSRTSASRVYMYVKSGQWAVWFDDDAAPAASGIVPREGADSGSEPITTCQAGNTFATGGTTTMLLGSDVFGKMETI
jgi:hypothetical protein